MFVEREVQCEEKDRVFEQYMKKLARAGKLNMCLRVFQSSRPIESIELQDRLIKDHSQLIRIALNCVYESPYSDQWKVMSDIFEVSDVCDR
jgi:hypothetical protein